jgi:hypothetical protein
MAHGQITGTISIADPGMQKCAEELHRLTQQLGHAYHGGDAAEAEEAGKALTCLAAQVMAQQDRAASGIAHQIFFQLAGLAKEKGYAQEAERWRQTADLLQFFAVNICPLEVSRWFEEDRLYARLIRALCSERYKKQQTAAALFEIMGIETQESREETAQALLDLERWGFALPVPLETKSEGGDYKYLFATQAAQDALERFGGRGLPPAAYIDEISGAPLRRRPAP